MSLVEWTLLSLWEKAAKKGLYRYDVTAYRTQTTPGSHGFLVQLNEGRITKKRASEFCIDRVIQKYDNTKFNFTKVSLEEVLFSFDAKSSKAVEFHPGAYVGESPNLVLINICPIEYGHVLLVPRVMDKLPQMISPDVMRIAFEFAGAIGNPHFRLMYNSFGAYASVNHMHFQGYFLTAPLPSERASSVEIQNTVFDPKFVRVSELVDYPVRGWVFEMTNSFHLSLQPLADAVGHVCQKLQDTNVPYNMMIVDCGARSILWPQCFQAKQAKGLVPADIVETEMMPAVSEISGHVILKRRKDFEAFTQYDVWRLLSLTSITSVYFAELSTLSVRA